MSNCKIHEARRGGGGIVIKGKEINQSEAEGLRRQGIDVVVCGPDEKETRKIAKLIEGNANGKYKCCPPHQNAGPRSLPHYQPITRPPYGHTFYETKKRKSS